MSYHEVCKVKRWNVLFIKKIFLLRHPPPTNCSFMEFHDYLSLSFVLQKKYQKSRSYYYDLTKDRINLLKITWWEKDKELETFDKNFHFLILLPNNLVTVKYWCSLYVLCVKDDLTDSTHPKSALGNYEIQTSKKMFKVINKSTMNWMLCYL